MGTRWQTWAICGFLLCAVFLVFGQTVRHEFIDFDDDLYVYQNTHVTQGLTAQGIGWAFTARVANNWHPLTWLSHMLDCQLYGLNAGGHHLTNVLLHATNAILLFLLLGRMTGALWRSAFVAAVFAIHPLRVESVAWVAERKDVLSGLFFMVTLWAYVGYVRHTFSLRRYLTVALLFALGLMCKPMLVTLPCVLLLLDYWPLGRLAAKGANGAGLANDMQSPRPASPLRLIVEKIPLFALAVASCVVTPLAQGIAVATTEQLSLSSRVANALVSYVVYIGQVFYPLGLVPFYPHPKDGLPIGSVAGAALVLSAITIAVVVLRRRCPYLFVGWFWYVGMLVPVIGLVQVGMLAMADRYTYLPQIGLYVALTWALAELAPVWRYRRWAYGIGASLVLLGFMGATFRQTSFCAIAKHFGAIPWHVFHKVVSRTTTWEIVWPIGGSTTKRYHITARRSVLSPTFRRSTLISAMPWLLEANSTRRSLRIDERWRFDQTRRYIANSD